MTPPTSIDGTEITGATIDGTDVTEITVDGDTVFAALDIPDEQELHARYDYSQESGSLPIIDQSGNGRDLGTGSYSGVNVTVNGVQAGEFNGSGDFAKTTFSTVSQPYHRFIVINPNVAENRNNPYADGGTSFEGTINSGDSGSEGDNYELFAGNSLVSGQGADAGDIVVISALFNGSNSSIRVNQNETTGNAGTSNLTGVIHGATDAQATTDVNVCEDLIYPSDKSAVVTDVEQFLIDKWGPVSFA
jgi:hypothetical protein